MGILKLVINNADETADKSAEAEAFIKQNAPAFAERVLLFILGKASHEELSSLCQRYFCEWWALDIKDTSPHDDYESVFWYLLFLIESRREDELLGNRFINQRIKECACYLINKGKMPQFAHGIRP